MLSEIELSKILKPFFLKETLKRLIQALTYVYDTVLQDSIDVGVNELDDLLDVTLTAPAEGERLSYDVATETWVNVDMPVLASGTWSPTVGSDTNLGAVVASVGQYLRVGDTVTCSGVVTVAADSAAACLLDLSLPVESVLADTWQLSGTMGSTSGSTTISGIVQAGTTNDTARLSWDAPDTNSQEIYYHFTYTVITDGGA